MNNPKISFADKDIFSRKDILDRIPDLCPVIVDSTCFLATADVKLTHPFDLSPKVVKSFKTKKAAEYWIKNFSEKTCARKLAEHYVRDFTIDSVSFCTKEYVFPGNNLQSLIIKKCVKNFTKVTVKKKDSEDWTQKCYKFSIFRESYSRKSFIAHILNKIFVFLDITPNTYERLTIDRRINFSTSKSITFWIGDYKITLSRLPK